MSDKRVAPMGEEKVEEKVQDGQTKRRRRRKKPKPEQQGEAASPPKESSQDSSTSPQTPKEPSDSKPPSPQAAGATSEKPKSPRRRRKKPRPTAPPVTVKEKPLAETEEERLLKWSVHLFKRRKKVSVLVVGLVLMTTYFTFWLYREWLLSIVVVLISVGALSAYFFPISYTLSDRGVKMVNFLAREDKGWNDFWTYFHYNDGIQLAYDHRKLKGRVRGGIMLYFDDGRVHQQKIDEIVKAHLPSPDEVGAYRQKR